MISIVIVHICRFDSEIHTIAATHNLRFIIEFVMFNVAINLVYLIHAFAKSLLSCILTIVWLGL